MSICSIYMVTSRSIHYPIIWASSNGKTGLITFPFTIKFVCLWAKLETNSQAEGWTHYLLALRQTKRYPVVMGSTCHYYTWVQGQIVYLIQLCLLGAGWWIRIYHAYNMCDIMLLYAGTVGYWCDSYHKYPISPGCLVLISFIVQNVGHITLFIPKPLCL